MSKFDGLITKEDQMIVESIFAALDEGSRDIINITETVENFIYLHPTFVEKMTYKEKIKSSTTLATFIDTLLDETINPLARTYLLKTFDVFNNNIFDVIGGNRYANQ